MTSLHFSDKAPSYRGQTPTHWTCESMRYCHHMTGGKVATTAEEAVRLSLIDTYQDRDDGSELPYVDPAIASGRDMGREVFGIVQVGDRYFWTGHIAKAAARVAVSVEEPALVPVEDDE